MKIIGFNFNKINVEKLKENINDLKINTKIDIKDIESFEPHIFNNKEKALKINFSYFVEYNPNFAKIELSGIILFTEEEGIIKNILEQWKDKQIPEDFKLYIFNIILRKSSLKALQLEEELNLPLHISLPMFRKQEKTNSDK